MDNISSDKKNDLSNDKRLTIQKFITLGELTANISHELKNLLLTISGYCDLMSEKLKQNDPVDEDLKKIKNASELARNIFMELLSFSKTGDKLAGKSEMNLNSLISELLTLLQANKAVKFDTQLDNGIEPVRLNPQKIKQVLINIIMNAIDSMKNSGEQKIKLTTGKLDYSSGLFIKIEDSGCGMNREVLSHLFKPFFTTKKTGTGLGLSVCWDIIREHNGYILVTSIPGKGSTFVILFLSENLKYHQDIIDI